MTNKGVAIVEYIVVILVIIAAMLAFRGYVQRAYQGSIARSGETFAYGRQFDPKDTIACAFDDKQNIWYAQACYNHNYAKANCRISADPGACRNTAIKDCTLGCQIK